MYLIMFSYSLTRFNWRCKIQLYYDEYLVKLMQLHQLKIKTPAQINKIHHLNDDQQTHSSKAILYNIRRIGGPHSLNVTTQTVIALCYNITQFAVHHCSHADTWLVFVFGQLDTDGYTKSITNFNQKNASHNRQKIEFCNYKKNPGTYVN